MGKSRSQAMRLGLGDDDRIVHQIATTSLIPQRRKFRNEQWRLCFVWTDRGVVDVEIADYH